MLKVWLPLLLTLAACDLPAPTPPPQPAPVADDGGAPPAPEPAASCKTACTNLRDRQCEAGSDTPNGATCEQVCENTEATPMSWDVVCLTDALSCGQCGY